MREREREAWRRRVPSNYQLPVFFRSLRFSFRRSTDAVLGIWFFPHVKRNHSFTCFSLLCLLPCAYHPVFRIHSSSVTPGRPSCGHWHQESSCSILSLSLSHSHYWFAHPSSHSQSLCALCNRERNDTYNVWERKREEKDTVSLTERNTKILFLYLHLPHSEESEGQIERKNSKSKGIASGWTVTLNDGSASYSNSNHIHSAAKETEGTGKYSVSDCLCGARRKEQRRKGENIHTSFSKDISTHYSYYNEEKAHYSPYFHFTKVAFSLLLSLLTPSHATTQCSIRTRCYILDWRNERKWEGENYVLSVYVLSLWHTEQERSSIKANSL